MKNKEVKVNGNVIEANFKEVNEMNENEVNEMENNEEVENTEETIDLDSEQWTMEDLKEARENLKELRRIRKAKKVLKKVAIGVTCVIVMYGAGVLITKKLRKGERDEAMEIKDDVKDVIDGVVNS